MGNKIQLDIEAYLNEIKNLDDKYPSAKYYAESGSRRGTLIAEFTSGFGIKLHVSELNKDEAMGLLFWASEGYGV